MTSTVIADRTAMHELGERISQVLRPGDLVVLSGPLGAGKTTLTQGIGRGLHVRGAITSPTFVIARVHPTTIGGPALVNVDAYRLGSSLEVDDLDLDAALSDSVTVVEWGTDKVEGLSEDRLVVHLERELGALTLNSGAEGDEPRAVTISVVGPRWANVDLTQVIGGADGVGGAGS